ncbi:trimeric LpxA-like protein [Rhizodiscina lignyota]|uniref:Trimeric LpxA-like protein n=1 Tax=Rhizodiscina lignyota TaxID=1504668 RepID=A0A9P4MCL5_9PEZI|nr:trimeric LpxA-like protein [Rhizodiscina lignyota]
MDFKEEKAKMARGELYHAFIPELVAERMRCSQARARFNATADATRRQRVQMWRDITNDPTPLPPPAPTEEEDDALFDDDAWVEPPIFIDYGYNVRLGKNVFLNWNTTIIDTCTVTIGDRTLFGPNCSLFSGTHPLDPSVRNGTQGPESGKPIWIGEDCWIGGNVVILPGVRIGRGSTVGAGSVVTKN